VPAPVATVPEPVATVLEVPEPVAPEALEPGVTEIEAPAAEAPQEAPVPIAITIIPPKPTITELKEKIMATAKTPDFTKPVTEAIGEIQTRAKAAYEKGTETLTEATEFAKGNVEAIVESGKILAAGAQDLGKTYVEEAKSAYETLSADLKEMASIKSPTELFQLQGKIARRNFDALVATSSKNTEAVLKLANDSFAPLTGRVNLAAEKLAKVA
jgi:phasin family protein